MEKNGAAVRWAGTRAEAGKRHPIQSPILGAEPISLMTRLRGRVRLRTRLRQWWKRWNPGRARLPRALTNGIPKAGTHLLVRCVELMPGMERRELELYHRPLIERLGEVEPAPEMAVLVGIDTPQYVGVAGIRKLLNQLRPGDFTGGHMPYSPAFEELLDALRFRMLFIVRDPRDVAVSSVFHILNRPQSPAHEYYAKTLKTDDERLLTCITGMIPRSLRVFVPWVGMARVYTTRFERLVGPQGGGSADDQRTEIENIARHLGIPLSPGQRDFVAANLFWEGSPTFRRGQIGSWREHFNDEHKAAFKRVAGQYLIELGYERDLDW